MGTSGSEHDKRAAYQCGIHRRTADSRCDRAADKSVRRHSRHTIERLRRHTVVDAQPGSERQQQTADTAAAAAAGADRAAETSGCEFGQHDCYDRSSKQRCRVRCCAGAGSDCQRGRRCQRSNVASGQADRCVSGTLRINGRRLCC